MQVHSYSRGHRKVPVSCTLNGHATVSIVLCSSLFCSVVHNVPPLNTSRWVYYWCEVITSSSSLSWAVSCESQSYMSRLLPASHFSLPTLVVQYYSDSGLLQAEIISISFTWCCLLAGGMRLQRTPKELQYQSSNPFVATLEFPSGLVPMVPDVHV